MNFKDELSEVIYAMEAAYGAVWDVIGNAPWYTSYLTNAAKYAIKADESQLQYQINKILEVL